MHKTICRPRRPQLEKICRIVGGCTIFLWLGFSSPSSAGLLVTEKEVCGSTVGAGASKLTSVFLDKAKFNPTHIPNIVIRDPGGESGNPACYTDTTLELVNQPEGPQYESMLDSETIGTAQTQILLTQFDQLWATSVTTLNSHALKATQCVYNWCAERPFLQFSGGLSIKEASPAYYFAQTAVDMQGSKRLAIPFVVVAAGDDDWLEFSNRGRIFWKARVNFFSVGQLYFAIVPDAMLTEPNTLWGIYINSTAPSDTKIYLPTYALPATTLGIK